MLIGVKLWGEREQLRWMEAEGVETERVAGRRELCLHREISKDSPEHICEQERGIADSDASVAVFVIDGSINM